MDYPIMTPRQKELSEKYREICSESGITVYETKGSDGSLFLDANVSSEPLELAKISELILRELLGAKDDTKLEFTLLP
jgi:hypothetical protein